VSAPTHAVSRSHAPGTLPWDEGREVYARVRRDAIVVAGGAALSVPAGLVAGRLGEGACVLISGLAGPL